MKDLNDLKLQTQCKVPNVYFVFAGKLGTVRKRNIEIKPIQWQKRVSRYIMNSSCIPRQWFTGNNRVHEVGFWFDGTAMYVHHGIKVEVLMCQFLEVDVNDLNQLQVYHTLATFPDKAVRMDVMEVIQLCYVMFCMFSYVLFVKQVFFFFFFFFFFFG